MGRNNKRELASRLIVLITHLLKWQFQSDKRSNSWINTINAQRTDIELLLKDSPSLKHGIETLIDDVFINAKRQFEKETKADKKKAPDICPYTWEQLSDYDFMPE
ncbi:protein of unknown function DUF29 [Candidatus Magnetoovum chiemensis]|nr:protein of unknown function DUF29 [Candidatus Magnetoovum chiemensis]